jgi:hypothetical protein
MQYATAVFCIIYAFVMRSNVVGCDLSNYLITLLYIDPIVEAMGDSGQDMRPAS